MVNDSPEIIRIRGARTHNLRTIDLDIPRGKLVVFTGVSGSGKTSLVFDTLFAAGQRRYIESLSPSVRQYLDQLERPDVDEIEGLPPTVSVSASRWAGGSSPRSLVATLTEIHYYLRVLYARLGDVFCYRCGAPLGMQTLDQIVSAVTARPEGDRLVILAPLVRGRKGEHRETLLSIRRDGFLRGRIDGVLHLVDPLPILDPAKVHDIEMVVDRQIVRPGSLERISESIRSALKHGQGTVIIAQDVQGRWIDQTFNTRLSCLSCQISYRELEPRTFSFNSPYGACPHCEGLGIVQEDSPNPAAVDAKLSLRNGAVAAIRTDDHPVDPDVWRELEIWAKEKGWLDVPYAELPQAAVESLWKGADDFAGLDVILQRRAASENLTSHADSPIPCPECHGSRLAPEGRSVRWNGLAIHQYLSLSIDDALEHARGYQPAPDRIEIAQPLLREIISRLRFLQRVGLGYVELDRPVHSLSGGEAHRIRLASCLGAGLYGACYILDEPTMGLHPADTQRLIETIEELRSGENSVLVVEHEPLLIKRADWIIDIGPGAGKHGGTIVNQGTYLDFIKGPGLTAAYLSGREQIARPHPQNISGDNPTLVLEGISHHNLRDVTLSLPLNKLVAITGVSGSGKSSLIIDVLAPLLRAALNSNASPSGRMRGVEHLARVVEVDQAPIGRTPRSCPATAVNILGPIRRIFAATREAKARGWNATRFSFTDKKGRCPACVGIGASPLELSYWPDRFIICPMCNGKRYNRATLDVRFRGHSIADVLDMNVDEAADFFQNHAQVHEILRTMQDVGLGYLSLGQWSTTLSGGEAQRLKLAAELGRVSFSPTLFILDEPTTGLHFHDVAQLLKLLGRLIDSGHSIVVIEHNLDVIRHADWIIDLGPGGGNDGGRIVAAGTPAEVASTDTATGRALRQ